MIMTVENKIGFSTDVLEDFANGIEEKPVEDIKADYAISGVGTFKLTFFKSQFLRDGVEFFRPVIRGFITLLLLFYNYKMILTFIGQDPGMYARAKEGAEE